MQNSIGNVARSLHPALCVPFRPYWIATTCFFLAAVPLALRSGVGFPIDDAYIKWHDAAAFRAQSDPNFRGLSPLTGATIQLHLLLAAGADAIMPPAIGLRCLSLADVCGAPHLFMLQDGHFWPQTGTALQSQGWQVTLLHANRNRTGYAVYALTKPNGTANADR